ncbi:TniQ family protein [Streptomyces sp. ISL-99]|uniref:TniQ family protein n=1 Tax=Streptomyces sp. ISL-99 TaxID=2819193 RepID=UPI001BE599D5|nr:TniQ family protein [Streptomyces sp. ISL-99]MBT2524132.1 TniQ family protein [Streptomyces sp. ISL-99]
MAGEALESWIGAYARRLRVTDSVFLEAAGMPGARTSHLALRLTADEAAALERATGVERQALTSMTLEPYDGLAVAILPDRRKLSRPPAWRFSGSRARYCPGCLGDNAGRGPVFWRLPWAFACTTHHTLLLDFCPDCHQPPHPWKARRLGPRATGACTRAHSSLGLRAACGADLTQALATPLPASGFVLAAQQHITTLLNGEPAARPTALAEVKQLYALAWRILRGLHTIADRAPEVVHTVVAECGGELPQLTSEDVGHDAHNAAVGTALARIALHPGHADHEALFEWILEADRSLLKASKNNIGAMAGRWTWSGPELVGRVLAKLDPRATLHARLRYASASPRPRWPDLPADAITRRAAMIPAMLWPGWTMRLLPRPKNSKDPRAGTFRRGCSSFLLLPGGPPQLNFERVGPLLGNQEINTDRDSIERRLYLDHDLTPLASTLAQLARALDQHGSPIDYARRRATFTSATVTLDLDAYTWLCAQQGWNPGQQHRVLLMRAYLLMLLTGEVHPPPEGASYRFAWHCSEFRFHAPRALRSFLRRQAKDNLTHHKIIEPVTWEPPDAWVTAVRWPGLSPADIVEDEFRDLLATSGTVRETAGALGLATEHVRLYCDLTATGAATPSDVIGKHLSARTVRTAKTREGILAPDRLHDLYVNQKLELTHIANLASCSPDTVRRLLRQDGIPLRPRPRRIPDRPDITREWLHHEYVERQRDIANLARERRVTHYHLTRMAKAWGITIRPAGGQCYNAVGHLHLHRPLSEDMRKVVMNSQALNRLRAITQISGHPSFAAAARSDGAGTDSALRQRVIGVEEAVGFQIIDRSVRPLAATERGQEFLREAAEILRIADAARLHQE